MTAYPDRRVDLQLHTDDGRSLGLFDSWGFRTVDGSVSATCEARIGKGGVLEFAPPEWLSPGFWENYYDGDQEAAKIVQTELSKIAAFPLEPRISDLTAP
ncbi:hypothetical protein [Paenarthrobacter nitroguajacolicus]|uniref:hypothetical protein n=1 Tax=Paenarthrobacter nitroguajacolicus TaxID=211146 RepID=UPI002856FD08|nr:hypothetical protein [Paenarthrobacter nitroguajacolicus]MDR6637086.1 hypothetical protein [Paenarthrobacter nitroguajacolicus]